jgi:hypothetical protein
MGTTGFLNRFFWAVVCCFVFLPLGCFQKNSDYNADAGFDGGADTDSDSDTDSDTDTDSDSDTDLDSDTDTDADPCSEVDCSDYGDCEVVDGGAVCDCEEGWFNSPDPADCGKPEIEVMMNATDISADGGVHDFLEMEVDGDENQASAYAAFTVKNTGTADLEIEDVYFADTDGDTSNFDLNDTSESPVAPGGETSFTIRFDPQEIGETSAFVTIANNDADESEFTFAVTGVGIDTTPPSYATGVIGFDNIDDTGFSVTWTKATDFISPQGSLQYRLYQSVLDDIGTVNDAEANGELAMNWTTDVSTFTATDLEVDTIYYFNVVVRDELDNRRAYSMSGKKTATPILLYSMDATVNLGGREGADTLCEENRPEHVPSGWKIKAFISVDEYDQLIDFTSGTGAVPNHVQIRGYPNNVNHIFAEDWDTLFFDGHPAISLTQAGALAAETNWFSGSNADGTSTEQTCNGWLGGIYSGTMGYSDSVDETLI